MENLYVVECSDADWNNLFLVRANNIKSAVNKVWGDYFSDQQGAINKGYASYYKKDLVAKRVDQLFEDQSDIICLW